MLIHAKRYWTEAITTMVWTYVPRYLVEQLNLLNVDDDGITPIEKFAGITTDTTPKNHDTWGCPV